MWCLTQTEVRLNLPFVLAHYFSGMDLGTMHSSTIYDGHWVTGLALSYQVDTSGMVLILIRDMGAKDLGKMRVLVQGVDRQWRVPDDDIVEPIRQVESEHIYESAFDRR